MGHAKVRRATQNNPDVRGWWGRWWGRWGVVVVVVLVVIVVIVVVVVVGPIP